MTHNYSLLFPFYPREYGIYRERVNTLSEFSKRVALDNGIKDVYVSVYDLSCTIDKVVFDIDSVFLTEALKEARKLYQNLAEFSIPTIPIFSGRKGFHIYALLEPWKPSDLVTAKEALRILSKKFTNGFRFVDPHLVGNVAALIRVPNTQHQRGIYCTYLRPEELDSLDNVLKFCRSSRSVIYDLPQRPKISELIEIPQVENKISRFRNETFPRNKLSASLAKNILRPCLYEAILKPNPPHIIRIELVSELLALDYSEEDVVAFIKSLNWQDFNEEITAKQVHQIYSREYLPFSCNKLREVVSCSECGWRYWWNGPT